MAGKKPLGKGRGAIGDVGRKSDDYKAMAYERQQKKSQRKLQLTIAACKKNRMTVEDKNMFDAIATELLALGLTEEDAREELYEMVLAAKQIVCLCGSTDFYRDINDDKLKCERCPLKKSLKEICPYIKHMKAPRLRYYTIYMKSRCAVYSNNYFAKTFGYTISACDAQGKKFDYVVAQHVKTLKAVEGIDSAEFLSSFHRRSLRTPANQKPSVEQLVAEENFDELEALQILCEEEKGLGDIPLRKDVSHLSKEAQIIYGHITTRPIQFESLLSRCGLEFTQLIIETMNLEILGFIVSIVGDNFVLKGADIEKLTNPSAKPQAIKSAKKTTKKKKKINQGHRDLAKSVATIIIGPKQGVSRRLLELHIADGWRTMKICQMGQPLDFMAMCLAVDDDVTLDALRKINCPRLVRLPLVA